MGHTAMVIQERQLKGVDAMDELIYNALSTYYNALEKKGYMSHNNSLKLLLLIFYRDFVFNDYRGLLNKEDYCLIEKALNCLYGSTCLIPYPDYLKMGKLHLGSISEWSRRIRTLEDTEVIKLMETGDVSSDSDVHIMMTEGDFISSFTVTPDSVIDREDSVIHIEAVANDSVTLQINTIIEGTSKVIFGPVVDNRISYDYTLENPLPGKVVFVLSATDGKDIATASQSVTVEDTPIAISAFNILPTSIYEKEESELRFRGIASRKGTLTIYKSDAVIYSVSDTRSIDYAYNVTPSATGILKYTLHAELEGKEGDSQSASVQIKQHPYMAMYYGNSTVQTEDSSVIKALNSTQSTTVNNTYNQAYYYIAVHSSKTLKTIISNAIEDVTGDFTLKNSSFVIDEYGHEEIYKLYECSINAAFDVEDMGSFDLKITIE